MRNLKKFLALVLAMIMVVGATAVVSADFSDVPADNRYAAAINDLAVKGIVKGTSETTFGPTQDVTRIQMALFISRVITGQVESDDVWTNGIVPFVDVTSYKGAVQCAYLNGIINGTSETTFAPNDGITYAAALKMAVCALGYGEGLSWPWGYYNKAVELGLTANLDVDSLDAELNRAETAQIIYNLLYATPADGGKTFAAKNFGIQLVENTTSFVITATPKQYYATATDNAAYNSVNDLKENYVGIQKLVNGVPNGDMLYVTVESLGIEAAKVEDYFNYSVELINFDETTKAFTGAVLGNDPTVITYKDVKYTSTGTATSGGKKLVIGDNTYTPVTANGFTGSALVNEIVVYDGTYNVQQAKVLLTNKDGNIVNEQGTVQAILAYESTSGAKYYAHNGKIITEAAALATFGVVVDDEWGVHINYATLTANNLDGKAYELKLFDDDKDGMYERAFYNEIHMGVYYTFKYRSGNSEVDGDGLLREAGFGNIGASGVAYSNADAKKVGAVSVYTYNRYLNTVNVIDILDMQTGIIDRINNSDNNLKLTVDGKVYNTATASTKASVLGASLHTVPNPDSDKYDVDDIADEAFIEYFDRPSFVDTAKVDNKIGFYAYNDYIIYTSVLYDEVIYNFAVIEDFADFDLAEIYLDMYVGDEYEEEALVTVMNGQDLERLSSYKFSMLLSKDELYYPGTIYEIDIVDDAYELYDIVDETNYTEFDLINAKVADNDYATALETANGVEADIADADKAGTITFVNGATTGERSNRIRTSTSTVFYFIEDEKYDATYHDGTEADFIPDPMNTTVTPFYGMPEDAEITFDENTQIWVDMLGYGNASTNGKASIVFVINPASHKGFFDTKGDVWVLTNLNAEYTEADSAEDLGLPEEYDGYYYMYSGKGVNLDDGSKITLYSKSKLTGNRLYLVDENGVVKTDKNGTAIGDTHPTSSPEVALTDSTTRNYMRYGIWNVNGQQAGSYNADGWRTDGSWVDIPAQDMLATGTNYFDYVWFTKSVDAADARNAYIQYLLTENLAEDWNGDGETNVDDFKAVPRNILDVELTSEMVYAQYIDEYVVIDLIDDNGNTTKLIDEDDDVVDIKVVEIISNTVTSGEDAIEILNASPVIAVVGNPNGDADMQNLFDAYINDGSIIFIVGYRNQDK